jgi:hypothetical protein
MGIKNQRQLIKNQRQLIAPIEVNTLHGVLTFDNMASKGLRAISYQGTRKVEAGYKPSHTSETLIGYIVCCGVVVYFSHYQFSPLQNP